MNQVYQKGDYKVYKADDGFILHNSRMEGFSHSHITSFKTCKYLIDLSIHKRIPHHLSRYLVISLLRVNDDEEYCRKIQELLDNHKRKDMYFNSNKGVRKK